MELAALEDIARNLEKYHVQYLVAGGMAVVAHGYGRMTFDIDLIIKLEKTNILNAFEALALSGYKPRVPISAEQFADPDQRNEWINNKGMVVLNMISDTFKDTPVDVFVSIPFDFDEAYETAMIDDLADGVSIRFVSIPLLISMKRAAGRVKDIDDIDHLEMLNDES